MDSDSEKSFGLCFHSGGFVLWQGNSPFQGVTEEPKMNWYPGGIHVSFHPVYGPATTHEHQEFHIDLKDHLAVTFSFIGEIIHKGCQAKVLATEETKNGFYHQGQ